MQSYSIPRSYLVVGNDSVIPISDVLKPCRHPNNVVGIEVRQIDLREHHAPPIRCLNTIAVDLLGLELREYH